MNKKYLLPDLKDEARMVSDECWEKTERIYDFLLDNMKLYYETSGSVFDEGSNAMPHMFEQMLLFHNIFFDDKHAEHDRAVMEWRAVLAILALQRVRNIKVEAVKVDLSEESNNPFIRAAASFRPEDEPVLYQTTWDYLYVFCLNGVPVAITSPLTIVCPAKMFKKKISKLDWLVIETVNQKTEMLFDFRGKGNEYADLGFWLRILRKDIIRTNPSSGETSIQYKKVKGELDKFIDLCLNEADLDVEADPRKGIYESMNNSIRKEYSFLNYCCDFNLPDKKMEFLVERYHNDIFQQKLLIVVYDDKPDAMFNIDNIDKLESVFHHILKIGNRKIISVTEPGGEPLAAYALLPFKKNFIKEMIERSITAEDFFDEYIIIYDHIKDVFEVRLSIKGFPYSFYKIYSHKNCQMVYGKEFVPTYIWPEKSIDVLNWKHYYTWVNENGSKIKVDIPYAVSSVEYQSKGDVKFKLLRTGSFPPYIRYSFGAVSGYIPVNSENIGMEDVGGTMGIFVDIGHTSTYVTMMKMYDVPERKGAERIAFCVPGSVNITGNAINKVLVNSSFVMPEKECREEEISYFRNVVHSFYSYKKVPYSYSVNPFEDGQALFYIKSCLEMLGDDNLHFLDFDYDQMKQQQKRLAHIFTEQILLFAIHSAILKNCSYIKIYFLHSYDDNNEQVGQLEGLWKHALQFGKRWTGISEVIDNSVLGMSEQKALAGSLYKNLTLRNESMERLLSKDSGKVFASVDIGWKKTLIAHIYNDDNGKLKSEYAHIKFGGYNIGMTNTEYDFQRYDEIVGIFLMGSRKVDENTPEGLLLKALRDTRKSKGCSSCYCGLFDLIAMQVEKNNYAIPPDVYNKMDEFRSFVKMMTYNISLLFLNIGYILGCMKKGNTGEKELRVYLGGNGAKFLKWVSNIKDYDYIDASNKDKVFIVGMGGYTILDILQKGFETGSGTKCKDVVIYLEHDMKEEMLNGYIFQEIPGFYGFNGNVPNLAPGKVNNCFTANTKQNFYGLMGSIKQTIFEPEYNTNTPDNTNNKQEEDISQVISANSEAICKEIIKAVNNMKSDD